MGSNVGNSTLYKFIPSVPKEHVMCMLDHDAMHRWGHVLPEHYNGKGQASSSLLKKLPHGCIAHDASYWCAFEVNGQIDHIVDGLQHIWYVSIGLRVLKKRHIQRFVCVAIYIISCETMVLTVCECAIPINPTLLVLVFSLAFTHIFLVCRFQLVVHIACSQAALSATLQLYIHIYLTRKA